MARENNFLLGYGQRLTEQVVVKKGGRPKEPPYDFYTARNQVSKWLEKATQDFSNLPNQACPNDQVTAVVTMHPRYISKSDFPRDLFEEIKVKPVGGRSKKVKPRQWGIKEHPEEALTDEIFVMGSRKNITQYSKEIGKWTEQQRGAKQLLKFELIKAYNPQDKIKPLPKDNSEILLEVVLHDSSDKKIIEAFENFSIQNDAKPVMDRLRQTTGLVFLPVYTSVEQSKALAQFSFIRVIRAMPSMRPFQPDLIRSRNNFPVNLPEEMGIDPTIKVAIFDGGLPAESPLLPWVNPIEPNGIGAPVPQYQEHGLAVTSALLFGPLNLNPNAPRPISHIDHIRVLDENTGQTGDFEYYDVLDRILKTLDNTEDKYQFVNISLGPDIPVDDDEITRWTASLDERFASGETLTTVAAGNEGERDSESGLNRIQPPSDGVNILSIGASDSLGNSWERVSYSCVGPGRCPGIVKPDGVVFGGSSKEPFMVLAATENATAIGTQGTSFASPYALRLALATKAQLGDDFSNLAIRSLLIHRADRGTQDAINVGWGRFETDYNRLITCEDDEALVVFQGDLPIREHLRVPLPLPEGELEGLVTVSATLVISPEVDPSYPNTYTRGGLEVAFRPNSTKFKQNIDGSSPDHAATKPFFNQKNIFGAGEYELREDGHKWEPCLKATQRYRASTLNNPCFDIYYHNRNEGMPLEKPKPIPYALVVSIRAPKVVDLYAQVVRTYSNILVPLQPKTRIQIRK